MKGPAWLRYAASFVGVLFSLAASSAHELENRQHATPGRSLVAAEGESVGRWHTRLAHLEAHLGPRSWNMTSGASYCTGVFAGLGPRLAFLHREEPGAPL